ncbi:MFS transporter [soil metagenome]
MHFLKKWGSLIILGLALSIIVIDTTLLNVSLATIIKDLHTDIQSLQWVITAYALTLAALTITGGRLGDFFGRKKMFVLGAIIFAIGSFIASISGSVGTLIWGEAIVEGIGAALMMPATASLLVANFQGRDRAIAFGVWGGLAGASSAIGPILGGFLTEHYSWRWGFRINVVVAAILVIGSIIVHESRSTDEKPNLDFVGVLLSATGLLSIIYGIIEASTYGWWSAKQTFVLLGSDINLFGLSIVPFIILLGICIIAEFLLWEDHVERSGKTPLVSLHILQNKVFTSGVITTAVITLGQVGMTFALPVFLQGVLKFSPFQTGISLLPLSIMLLIMAPLSAVLSSKVLPKYMILTGLVLNVIGIFAIRAGLSVNATAWNLTPGLAIFGAGMGMVMAQISNLTLSAVPVSQAGEASGINNTMRQVGSSLGSAIIGAVLLSALTTNITTGINGSTIIPQAVKSQLVDAVSTQTSNVEFGGGAKLNSSIPQPIVKEIETISKQATVDAAKTSLLYAAFFALLGFIAALFLPTSKKTSAGAEGKNNITEEQGDKQVPFAPSEEIILPAGH